MLTLVAVNSKYVHMNLAVRKIRAYLQSLGLDACIKAVSYTHLDVYKRQL